jgi:hypothetical protein
MKIAHAISQKTRRGQGFAAGEGAGPPLRFQASAKNTSATATPISPPVRETQRALSTNAGEYPRACSAFAACRSLSACSNRYRVAPLGFCAI